MLLCSSSRRSFIWLVGLVVPVSRVATSGSLKLVSAPLTHGQKLTVGSPALTGGVTGLRQSVPRVLLVRSAIQTVLASWPHDRSVTFSPAIPGTATPAHRPDALPFGAHSISNTWKNG